MKGDFIKNKMWFILFFFITIVLVWANRAAILSGSIETGDFAANTLLVLDAKSFHLLIGNYSRLGFNHPGPAILYVLAAGELLFYDLLHIVKMPFSAQLISVAFYNAFWICLLGCLFFRMISSRISATLSFVVFLFTVSILNSNFFIDIWFPSLYFFPFAVALLSLARLSEGKTDSMIFLALSSGFLINGHACFIPVLGILLLISITYNFIYTQDTFESRIFSVQFVEKNKRILLLSTGILFIFFIPLIVMTIKEFPGPIAQYIGFGAHHNRNTVSESIHYVSVYWGGVAAMFIGMLACVASFFQEDKNHFSLRSMYFATFAATITALFYANFGVDQLDQPYIEYFYYSAPALLAATLTSTILQHIESKTPRLIFVVLSIVLILGCVIQINRGPYRETEPTKSEIVDIYNQLKMHKNNPPLVLDFDNVMDWGKVWSTMVGVEAFAKRSGDDLFCINRNWNILFTKQAQCNAAELLSGTRYIVKPATNEALSKGDFQVGGLSFIQYTLPTLNGRGYISIRDNPQIFNDYILTSGWYPTESTFAWSSQRKATLSLNISKNFKTQSILLDLQALLPHKDYEQTIQILIENKVVAQASFTRKNNRKSIVIPMHGESGNIQLKIVIDHPIPPSFFKHLKDSRKLGISLYGLQIMGYSSP